MSRVEVYLITYKEKIRTSLEFMHSAVQMRPERERTSGRRNHDRIAHSREKAPKPLPVSLEMNRLNADQSARMCCERRRVARRTLGALATCIPSRRRRQRFFLIFQFECLHKFQVQNVFRFAAQQIGEAAGHAGTKIQANGAENDGDAAGHVFTAVLADAFDDGNSAAVANGKTLASLPGDEQLAGSRAVEHGVARENVAALGSGVAGADGDCSAGEAFADVVVGFAEQFQVEPSDREMRRNSGPPSREIRECWEPAMAIAEGDGACDRR